MDRPSIGFAHLARLQRLAILERDLDRWEAEHIDMDPGRPATMADLRSLTGIVREMLLLEQATVSMMLVRLANPLGPRIAATVRAARRAWATSSRP